MNKALWGEMVNVLKDISSYLEKQDAEQERADIDKPPKTGEDQKPMEGGDAPDGEPGEGIAKQYVEVPDAEGGKENEEEEIDSDEDTVLKQDEETENGDEETEEEVAEETPAEEEELPVSDEEELKSLLKDIKSALTKNVTSQKISKAVTSELKKTIPNMIKNETTRMLRKMGFTPSRPDVVRFGVDEDIKKSEETSQYKDLEKTINVLSKKSFAELGNMRENLGHFNPFNK